MKPTVVIFCMAEMGHFRQLRPLLSDLVQCGAFSVCVFTHRLFSADVECLGATFVDLFGKYPIDRVDAESVPIPSRYVTYAAAYIENVLDELRHIRPVLIIYETFSVIGRLAAQILGIPFVNVSAGHNVDPDRYLTILHSDPRVAISNSCRRAVDMLRERYDLRDASPFSYVTGLSPYLNICCQPREFLADEERMVFEPVAFYGCMPSWVDAADTQEKATRCLGGTSGGVKIYAAFGTTVFRYYSDVALGVFTALAECLESMPDAHAQLSLGGAGLDDRFMKQLMRPNVEVVDYADQWAALGAADIFLTHHGMNSTHEAIVHRAPMLSYPFFWDQPALARKCNQLGIAIPLAETPRAAVTAAQIQAKLHQILARRDSLYANLDRARCWENDVIAQRGSVLQRLQELT